MNIADEIQRLHELREKGALTEEEFARAKGAVLDGEGKGRGGSCYKCEATPERACALCGRMFCGQHGGERWLWLAKDGGRHGARNNLTKRVICDECTPDPTRMKISVIVTVSFFIAVLAIMLVAFLSFFRE